jgi:uncharacterized protein YsxB (DUF464 family)
MARVSILGTLDLSAHLDKIGANAQGKCDESKVVYLPVASAEIYVVFRTSLSALATGALHVLGGLLHHRKGLVERELVDAVVHTVKVVGHANKSARNFRVVSPAVTATGIRASHLFQKRKISTTLLNEQDYIVPSPPDPVRKYQIVFFLVARQGAPPAGGSIS